MYGNVDAYAFSDRKDLVNKVNGERSSNPFVLSAITYECDGEEDIVKGPFQTPLGLGPSSQSCEQQGPNEEDDCGGNDPRVKVMFRSFGHSIPGRLQKLR